MVSDAGGHFEAAQNRQLRAFSDPLILDLDGDGIELLSRASANRFFDMDGDGRKEWTGWVGPRDGLVVRDENGNGKIDSVKELMGDQTRSGFAELKTLDSNKDGVFDSKDAAWSSMRVWVDTDGDAVTDPGELLTFAQAKVRSIDLNYTTVNFTAEGNLIHEQATFERTDGTTGTVVDAWFEMDNVGREYEDRLTGDPTVDALPDIRALGDVDSLRDAMAKSGQLTSLVSSVTELRPDQLAGVRGTVEQILYRWAGTTGVATDGRGPNIDGRDLATLEKFLATRFLVSGSANPVAFAAEALRAGFDALVDNVLTRLLLAGAFSEFAEQILYLKRTGTYVAAGDTDLFATLPTKAPADSSSVASAHYWIAAATVAREIAEDAKMTPAEIQVAIDAMLRPYGLAGHSDLFARGVTQAVVEKGDDLLANGITVLTPGADFVRLMGSDQVVYGEGGNDTIVAGSAGTYAMHGGAGSDFLQGSSGRDVLDGGTGTDTMYGGDADDDYFVDSVGDLVLETNGGGSDTVFASISYTLGASVEKLVLLGTAKLSGTGNGSGNRLSGNDAPNVLKGLAGNDIIDGRGGADTMEGGIGDDTYFVDNRSDVVIESYSEGTDEVISSLDYTLGRYVERLTLAGTALRGNGNDLNNVIIGNEHANLLDGRGGADRLEGGAGNDVYIMDQIGDSASEAADGGIDTVRSTSTQNLDSNVENLQLIGTADVDGTGNGLANRIIGNSGANVLDGGGGKDRLEGLGGNDTYIVDAEDVVVEAVNSGVDTVRTSIGSLQLGANLENLVLYRSGIDTALRDGTGNSLNNTITGNNGTNTLRGLGGDDTLIGNGGTDRLEGGAGDDLLDGGSGIDLMLGGAGNDFYVVEVAGDRIVEAAGGGIDTVRSSISYVLGAEVENLELSGGTIDGSGNALNNVIVGTDGKNVLDGRAGADTMIGGRGDDTYTVDDAGDLVIEMPNAGTDHVKASVSYILGVGLENMTLIGTARINGTGNTQDNAIIGNAAANVLMGGKGADTMTGGGGADVFRWARTSDGSPSSSKVDVVLDFSSGQGDRIDLRSIDADVLAGGDQAFALDLDGSFSIGEIRQRRSGSDLYLEINTDNAPDVEMTILLKSVASVSVTDFLL